MKKQTFTNLFVRFSLYWRRLRRIFAAIGSVSFVLNEIWEMA